MPDDIDTPDVDDDCCRDDGKRLHYHAEEPKYSCRMCAALDGYDLYGGYNYGEEPWR